MPGGVGCGPLTEPFQQWEFSLRGPSGLSADQGTNKAGASIWSNSDAQASKEALAVMEVHYALGRFSVLEARKPCAVASFSHM
jgi:hypothetical protein